MAVDTDGCPCLKMGVDVLPDAFWLGAEGVADKVDGGCVVLEVTIRGTVCLCNRANTIGCFGLIGFP